VSDLVRRKVTQPRQDELALLRRIALGQHARRVGLVARLASPLGSRRLEVAPHARRGPAPVRIDARHGVQDLAGSRIGLEIAHRPGALGAVDPLDARVARVEEGGALG
jgi:hypothetical protein